jgi:hypothetical protein
VNLTLLVAIFPLIRRTSPSRARGPIARAEDAPGASAPDQRPTLEAT